MTRKNKDRKLPHYYHSLTRNIILIIIVVSFTPMIMISSFILHQFRVSYEKKLDDHLAELVLKHKQSIDSFLKEKLSNIKSLSAIFTLEQFSDDEFLTQRLRMFREEYGTVFEDMGVVNDEGIQMAYAGPFKLKYADYSKAEWFRQAIQNQYFVSDVFMGLREKPHFIVSVRRQSNGKYWILRATIDFLAFNSLVENLRIGQTGFAFILNKNGDFQTKPFFRFSERREHIEDYLRGGIRTANDVYIARGNDGKNGDNIHVGTFLKGGDWLLVYQQGMEDAFSDFRRAQRIVILILIIGGLCITLTAILLSRRVVGRLSSSEEEKEMMNQQVIETGKLATVGELAAGIAHEINNPVAIMVEEAGWIEDLLEEEDLSRCKNIDEFRRALRQINTQGKRCKEITHKLLSFARKTDTRLQEVQINDLTEEVVGLASQQAKYDSVEIRTSFRDSLPYIHVSPTEIQQVLLNLINNAIYAMSGKGGFIDITTRLEDKNIFIDVADNGTGIPQANLARIFDPFFTTKPVGKGSGLGLSICYGIIKKMGGDIEVQSVMGEGTTFTIRLPLDAAPGEKETPADDAPLSADPV